MPSHCCSVSEILDNINENSPTLYNIAKEKGIESANAVIILSLKYLKELAGIDNLNQVMVDALKEDIYNDFGYLTFEELKIAFRNGIKKTELFGRLDFGKIMRFLADYNNNIRMPYLEVKQVKVEDDETPLLESEEWYNGHEAYLQQLKDRMEKSTEEEDPEAYELWRTHESMRKTKDDELQLNSIAIMQKARAERQDKIAISRANKGYR